MLGGCATKSAGTAHFKPISTILLEDDDDHTSDDVVVALVVVDDDDDDANDGDGDGDDDDDDDPVELFQKRGKWWNLIVTLLF